MMSDQKNCEADDRSLESGPLGRQLERERAAIDAAVASIPERTWELQAARIRGAIAEKRKPAVHQWRAVAAAAAVVAVLTGWPLYRMLTPVQTEVAAVVTAEAVRVPATVPAMSELLEEPWNDEPLSDYAAVIDWESWLDDDSREGES